jgi:DNA-3-methyladenine glycosylase II
MAGRVAENPQLQAFEEAASFLASVDGDWAQPVARVGPRRYEPKSARAPYEALVRAIADQQLHAKAGDAILGRLLALYPGVAFPSPEQLLATEPTQQRACVTARNGAED